MERKVRRTDVVGVNRPFLTELYEEVGEDTFTGLDAYDKYIPYLPGKGYLGSWGKSNVQKLLNASTRKGLLERISSDSYRFVESPEEFKGWKARKKYTEKRFLA